MQGIWESIKGFLGSASKKRKREEIEEYSFEGKYYISHPRRTWDCLLQTAILIVEEQERGKYTFEICVTSEDEKEVELDTSLLKFDVKDSLHLSHGEGPLKHPAIFWKIGRKNLCFESDDLYPGVLDNVIFIPRKSTHETEEESKSNTDEESNHSFDQYNGSNHQENDDSQYRTPPRNKNTGYHSSSDKNNKFNSYIGEEFKDIEDDLISLEDTDNQKENYIVAKSSTPKSKIASAKIASPMIKYRQNVVVFARQEKSDNPFVEISADASCFINDSEEGSDLVVTDAFNKSLIEQTISLEMEPQFNDSLKTFQWSSMNEGINYQWKIKFSTKKSWDQFKESICKLFYEEDAPGLKWESLSKTEKAKFMKNM